MRASLRDTAERKKLSPTIPSSDWYDSGGSGQFPCQRSGADREAASGLISAAAITSIEVMIRDAHHACSV